MPEPKGTAQYEARGDRFRIPPLYIAKLRPTRSSPEIDKATAETARMSFKPDPSERMRDRPLHKVMGGLPAHSLP